MNASVRFIMYASIVFLFGFISMVINPTVPMLQENLTTSLGPYPYPNLLAIWNIMWGSATVVLGLIGVGFALVEKKKGLY